MSDMTKYYISSRESNIIYISWFEPNEIDRMNRWMDG